MIWLYLLAGLSAAFLLRIAPLWLWGRPDLTVGDVMNHLYLVDGYRDNNHRLPDFQNKFLLTDPENYPTLYHKLLSYLPARVVDFLEPALGSIVETVHAAFLFGLSYWLCRQYGGGELQPEAVALAAVLMFAATPLLLGIENINRVYRMCPRSLGVLLNALVLTGIVLFLTSGSWLWLLAAGAVGGFVVLTSTFGLQALVFLTAGISLFALDARPLLVIPMTVVWSLVWSRGGALRVLAANIHHSWFYCTYLSKRHKATVAYTIRNLLLWPVTLFKAPKEALKLLATHYVLISFTLMPWTVLLIASYALHPRWLTDSPVEQHLLAWCLAGLAVMGLTATRWFRFWGEASRYIIHSATPICLLAAWRTVALADSRLTLLAGALTAVALVGVACSYLVARLAKSDDADRRALYEWMRQQPSSTLLTIHMRLSYLLCFRTPHRTVNVHINFPRGEKRDAYKQLVPKWYPFPDTDLKSIVGRYNIDLLVVDDKALRTVRERDPSYVYDFSQFDEIYQQGRFRVLRPKAAALSGAVDGARAA